MYFLWTHNVIIDFYMFLRICDCPIMFLVPFTVCFKVSKDELGSYLPLGSFQFLSITDEYLLNWMLRYVFVTC